MKYLKNVVLFFWVALLSQNMFAGENWKIIISDNLKSDEAIKVALEDLKNIGSNYGIEFVISEGTSQIENNTILVGSETRSEILKNLVLKNNINLVNITEEQSFQIITTKIDSKNVMIVSGGSILGEVYGLYWIYDRLKVIGFVPEINTIREPELKIRFTSGNTKEQMRQA